MAKYYCVLFDADNTLLDFDAAENKALAGTLREYGIEPDERLIEFIKEPTIGVLYRSIALRDTG